MKVILVKKCNYKSRAHNFFTALISLLMLSSGVCLYPSMCIVAATFLHRKFSFNSVRVTSLQSSIALALTPSNLIYNGPLFDASEDDSTPARKMVAILELGELGIDIAVGPSMIAPGQFGLYARCSYTNDSVALPECTLLCGYSKSGVFLDADVGDRTVGFSLTSGTTAVFFERELMEVQVALTKAAIEYGNGACGLAGHELSMTTNDQEETVTLHPMTSGFDPFFCPEVISLDEETASISVQNFGQYCNDLAWNQMSPPSNLEEYIQRSAERNCVQLVWRLSYDAESQCLIPTWPVSVLSRDVRFENHDFMELGTRYGWNYWQATVHLDDLM
jgi:hypothetical protein